MSPFDKARYGELLKGLEISEVRLKDVGRRTPDFRMEAEFFTAVKHSFSSVPGEKAVLFSQYGTSEELNEQCKGYPVLRLNEFDAAFIGHPAKYCELSSDVFSELQLRDGDVLICRTNGNPKLVGKSALVPKDYQYAFASYLFRVRPDLAIINSETLVAYLNSRFGRHEIEQFAMRGNQANFSPAKFRQIQIPVLGSVVNNAVKELTRKAFSNNEKSKVLYRDAEQALLDELGFVDWSPTNDAVSVKSYSDFVSVGRFDAEYFQLKYIAIDKKIRNYCGGIIAASDTLVSGLVNEDAETEERYVELADIGTNGEITGCMSATFGKLPSRARQRMENGQVIVSSIEGSLDKCALVTPEFDKALCSTGFHRFRSTVINAEILLLLFKSWPIQQLMKRGCSGTILSAILPGELSRVPLPLVDPKVQRNLAAKVQSSFALRAESRRLLDLAKCTVEIAIDHGEGNAMDKLRREINHVDQ